MTVAGETGSSEQGSGGSVPRAIKIREQWKAETEIGNLRDRYNWIPICPCGSLAGLPRSPKRAR